MPVQETPIEAVQLGTLQLLIVPNRHLSSDWRDLATVLPDLLPKDLTEGRAILDTLGWILKDDGLAFGGSVRVDGPLASIRVHLLPSDAPGSRWRETAGKKGERRKTQLKKLFAALKIGWDHEGLGTGLTANTEQDLMRMHELYSSVPSPPEPHAIGEEDDDIFRRLADNEEPEGIKARLYRYQFMEIKPDTTTDPGFTRFRESGRDGVYYIKLHGSMDIQRNPSRYELPKGGVLCEEMGVGKTLMCLSLICATLHQPCQPDPTNYDITKTITNVRLRDYPFEAERVLREAVGQDEPKEYPKPTLQELCADILVTVDASIHHSPLLATHYQQYLDRHGMYFSHVWQDDSCRRRVKQLPQSRPAEITKVYLANTTLIVVPKMQVDQWKHEVEKHVHEDALKVLVIRKEMPDVKVLMRYDVVIMSVERFAYEGHVRVGDTSELLRARWKRLILDEGHVAGSNTSNAMRLAIQMSIERRWAVSGTPTKHLQQGGEAELSIPSRRASPAGDNPAGAKSSKAWSKHDLDDVGRFGVIVGGFLSAEPFKSDAAFQEAVTSYLRKPSGPVFGAVQRLRALMNALMVKHQPRVIDGESLLPPCTREVTTLRFHPMQRLTYNVLASLVTANVYQCSSNDISHFLHPKNAKSFNSVVANLKLACFWYSAPQIGAMNCLRTAVAYLDPLPMSERMPLYQASLEMGTAVQDGFGGDVVMVDAMRRARQEEATVLIGAEEDIKPNIEAIEALPELDDAAEARRRSMREDDKTVDTRPDSHFLENDHEQLYDDPIIPLTAKIKIKEACRHLRDALTTPGWSEWMQNGVSLPFEAPPDQFPARVRATWSDSMNDAPDAIDSHSLALLRDANRRGATEQSLHIKGWDARAFKCSYFFEVMEKYIARDKLEAGKRERADRAEADKLAKEKGHGLHASGSTAAGPARQLLKAGEKKKEKKKVKDPLEKNLDEAKRNAKQAKERSGWVYDETVPRVLPDEVMTTSRCAKINHIMQRMREAPEGDRFVIFGENLELGHVSEALDLIDIKHTSAVSSNTADIRIQSLRDFEQDPSIRVILLETKLAARGLNLVQANRMIFLAPLWSLDVQAQAIKRVHRIGQTKPTHIETLVMEGTYEEDTVNRAASVRSDTEGDLYTREMIKHPRFVDVDELPTTLHAIPFIPHAEQAFITSLTTPPLVVDLSVEASPASDVLVTPGSTEISSGSRANGNNQPENSSTAEAGPGPRTTAKRRARFADSDDASIKSASTASKKAKSTGSRRTVRQYQVVGDVVSEGTSVAMQSKKRRSSRSGTDSDDDEEEDEEDAQAQMEEDDDTKDEWVPEGGGKGKAKAKERTIKRARFA